MKRVESLCKSCRHGIPTPGHPECGLIACDEPKPGFCGWRNCYAGYEPTDPTIDREAKIKEYHAYEKSIDWLVNY